jgi:transcriptional regulator with XRE-family HTH domain
MLSVYRQADVNMFSLTMTIDELQKLVGNNLERLRVEKGYVSQEALARDVETPVGYINSIIKGHRGLGADVMIRICTVLKIHPKELFDEPDAPRQSLGPICEKIASVCSILDDDYRKLILKYADRIKQVYAMENSIENKTRLTKVGKK